MQPATPRSRRRKYAWLQIATHIGAWIPLLILGWNFYTNNLTVNPVQALEQRTGDTAIVILLLSLACTPLYTFTRFAPLLKLRRPLGLYAFMYASIHLSIFVGLDYLFDFQSIWLDTSDKRYIWVGLAAFLILVPIAITSIRWFVVHMGKSWKRLHQLVYLVGVLVSFHFAWVVKGNLAKLHGDVIRPALVVLVLALLLLARFPPVRKRLAALGRGWFSGFPRRERIVIQKKVDQVKEQL